MPNDTVLNSSGSASDQTQDDDDLKALKLTDTDLDHFARYFEQAFQGNSRSIIVLVALLQRLRGVDQLRQQKQSGVWLNDIVGGLTHRLYSQCEPGFEAAARFANEASDLTEHIFASALRVPHEW